MPDANIQRLSFWTHCSELACGVRPFGAEGLSRTIRIPTCVARLCVSTSSRLALYLSLLTVQNLYLYDSNSACNRPQPDQWVV